MAAESRGLGFQVDSMQFYADLVSEILGECPPSSKNLHLKQTWIEWPKMIVTDARDVYDKLLTEKSGLPQQKALTLEIATIRELLVNSDAQIRWTADENMIMNGLTKDNKESRQHMARALHNGEWSVCTTRRHVTKSQCRSQSVHDDSTRRTRSRVKKCTTSEIQKFKRSELRNKSSMRQCHRLWKIAEFEEIIDIPVLQMEFVWFSGSNRSPFLLWHGALHTD